MDVNFFNKLIKFQGFESDKDRTNVVYKIVFPDNTVYIGKTNLSIDSRIHDHCKDSRNPKTLVNKKINEVDSFKVIRLCNFEDPSRLAFAEKKLIQDYAIKLLSVIEGNKNPKLVSSKIPVINNYMLNEQFYF